METPFQEVIWTERGRFHRERRSFRESSGRLREVVSRKEEIKSESAGDIFVERERKKKGKERSFQIISIEPGRGGRFESYSFECR